MLTTNELQERFKNVEVTADELATFDSLAISVKAWILLLCDNDHATAIFLSQLLYWTEKKAKEGKDSVEIYKTIKEWEKETGLSRYQQEKARRLLKSAGILTERRKRIANCMCVVHYTLNLEVLQDYMKLVAKQAKSEGKLERFKLAQERKFKQTAEWKAKNAARMKNAPLKTKLQLMQEKLAEQQRRNLMKAAKKQAIATSAANVKNEAIAEQPPQQKFVPKLMLLMRNPELCNRITELQKEGLSYKEAHDKALFERDQLSLI